MTQIEHYWYICFPRLPPPTTTTSSTSAAGATSSLTLRAPALNSSTTANQGASSSLSRRPPDSFDIRRHAIKTSAAPFEEGWRAEVRSYLTFCNSEQNGVEREADLMVWWPVSFRSLLQVAKANRVTRCLQANTHLFPTFALAARDVLAVPASSVPCERLFSSGKQVATDRRSCLGSDRFEELQVMKSAWKDSIFDFATWNSEEVEDISEFEELLIEDIAAVELDKELAGIPMVSLDL